MTAIVSINSIKSIPSTLRFGQRSGLPTLEEEEEEEEEKATRMFTMSETAIDPGRLNRELADTGAGALVSFEGRVRNINEGRTVERLSYQAYGDMAVKEGERLLAEACSTFPIQTARCVHRTGTLELGEIAVWIGVLSAHRAAAFDACRFIIDTLKVRVPIWKKEHYTDGESEWIGI